MIWYNIIILTMVRPQSVSNEYLNNDECLLYVFLKQLILFSSAYDTISEIMVDMVINKLRRNISHLNFHCIQ